MKKVLSILLLLNCAVLNANFEAIEAYQRSMIEEEITGSNVAMVFQDGKSVYHHVQNSGKPGDKDITPDTIFPLFSMSKPVTTVAIMTLYEKGLLDLDDSVSKYLPELADPKCKGEDGVYDCINELKIIHLLSHRSGYYYYIGSHGLPSTKKHDNLEDFVDAVAELPLEFEPGTEYQYGLNQAILGCVVETITGKSFYEYLKESLFDPLGMENTKFYVTDRMYKFIPDEERFVVYPIPLRGTYTRDMTFDENGRIITSNNPLPTPAFEGGVLEIISIDPDYDADKEAKLVLSQK